MQFDALKDFMERLCAWRIPGNAICVYKDGRQVFRYQAGYADVERKKKMDGSELMNIWSCSKVATVTAALQLYEKGYFLLSDPLYDFIPAFRDMYVQTQNGLVRAKNPITMRHLFTMTAGLTYKTDTAGFAKARHITNGKMDTQTVVRCIAEDPLAFEPGTHFAYSLCHDVLAAVVEIVSGKRFCRYMEENIFAPLGMHRTCYHADDAIRAQMAQQYRYVNSGETDVVTLQKAGQGADGYWENAGKEVSLCFGEDYDSGGAGIITSVDDYVRLVAALAGRGTGIGGERILSPATVELMRTNQLTPAQAETFNWPQHAGYGYGLGVRTMVSRAESGSGGACGEFGWGGAAGATVLADPEASLAVFYAHHMLNAQETYYQPRLRNVVYGCL